MDYYANGSLEDYITREPAPSYAVRHRWICEISDIVARCHEKHVLIFDISLRNCVFATDYSIRLIDFANSVLVPAQEEMTMVEVDGCTVKLDLLHLANVICSIAKWEKFSVDCAMDDEWPDISQQPSLHACPYTSIILRCWNRQYENVQELQRDLKMLPPYEHQ